jgi:electron transport complex protein RnfC
LAALPQDSAKPETAPVEQDAASVAIERAKAKAAASASMSPEEKMREQVASMEKRLEKAKERLKKAETEDDKNVEAFRSATQKLEDKLAAARGELEALN